MAILIRYLSLVVKLVTATLIWSAVFSSMARAESHTFQQVKESLWTMGLELREMPTTNLGEEVDSVALEESKDLPEELQKALETF